MSEKLLIRLEEAGYNFRDFLPILAVVMFFQWFIVGEPMPDVWQRVGGVVLTLIGLTLFVRGLDMSIFSLGQSVMPMIVIQLASVALVG